MDFDDIITSAIGGTIAAGAAALLFPQVRRKVADAGRWITGKIGEAKASEQLSEEEQVSTLREQVLDVARARGEVLPVTARGSRPTVVKYSDGGVSHFYGDLPTFKRVMNGNRRTDPQRSFHTGFNGYPVSRWNRAELEGWLSENAGP